MKRVKRLAVLIMAAAVLLLGSCGRGDKSGPEGIYEHNRNSLDFSEDSVVITEGEFSSSCDYTIDKHGELVIDPKGEEIIAQYDAETDTVTVYGVKYRKR